MGRDQKNIYCFIHSENDKFYTAAQKPNGDYIISSNSMPSPLKFNPVNLITAGIEFATNSRYFSLTRSISYPLEFVKDGAAILRQLYFLGKLTEEKVYFKAIEWNGTRNLYELAYKGRIDLSEKNEDPKAEMFNAPTVDDSVWGIISQNDDVEYAIDCTSRNPKAIRVLLDGITLVNQYTFQTVQAPLLGNGFPGFVSAWSIIPFILINEDGDSVGVIAKNQVQSFLNKDTPVASLKESGSFFFSSAYALPGFNIQGTIKFSSQISSGQVILYLASSVHNTVLEWIRLTGAAPINLINGKIYSFPVNITRDLVVGEKLFIVMYLVGQYNGTQSTITPIVTNVFATTKTRPQPVVRYGIRAIDFLEEISAKATNNRYSIKSDFFSLNNKDVLMSGDSIRDIPNAKIYSNIKDFFSTFSAIYWMAFRSINGNLFLERVIEVYKQVSTLLDIGEIVDLKLTPATEYICNEVLVGSPDVDYRHPSGRLEFNSTNSFSLPIFNTNKKLEIITKYRLGCYDITFLILDYQGESTKDNSGDKQVYVVKITDQQGSATEDVETFENVNVDDALLEPIIKSPLTNDVISNATPVVRGIANPGLTVNIYVDSVLDGSAVSDVNGKWNYQIVAVLSPFVFDVTTGIHVIQATFGTLADPLSTSTILIDTSFTEVAQITYPNQGDSLYNNIPLIKGQAQAGVAVNVQIDGVSIGTVVADQSCKWEIQSPVMTNGSHIITANTDSVAINVNSSVDYPLITYIGSELDGFVIISNLPLIKGVAIPGTIVTLWLNYISYIPLGSTTADANGNWSFQVVPVTYPDVFSGVPTVLTPIRNGLSIIGTSLINHVVKIQVSGYLLERPNFTSITGVPDNTVFNTAYTPKRMLLNHKGLFASIGVKMPDEKLYFQKPGKNAVFTTVIAGETIQENADVPFSSLGSPLMLLENAEVRTKTQSTFHQTLENFNAGGIIKAMFRGTDLYFLPIGSMKMNNLTSEVKDWKLLFSPQTTFQSLLNLYKNGLTIKLMKNSIYISDYNSIHFVKYNFSSTFNFKEINEDWFENRNDAWIMQPQYIQKYNSADPLRHQIITNGVGTLYLDVYRCKDAYKVDTLQYNPIVPAPINPPDIVSECIINLSVYGTGAFFFVLTDGTTSIAISERIDIQTNWKNTILIDSGNSKNLVGFFYSTGIRTILRVEGLVKKWQPLLTTFVAEEESGNKEMLYAVSSKKRIIRFGSAYGLPDYLYLKVALALAQDDLFVENYGYVLSKEEKITPSDDVEGHPLYYYNVVLESRVNELGYVYAGGSDSELGGVVLVVDATAFGLPVGSLININVNNE